MRALTSWKLPESIVDWHVVMDDRFTVAAAIYDTLFRISDKMKSALKLRLEIDIHLYFGWSREEDYIIHFFLYDTIKDFEGAAFYDDTFFVDCYNLALNQTENR